MRNMMKYSTETFVAKAQEIHGYHKYDYSKVVYTVYKGSVQIICKRHGVFWQLIASHLRGRGCKRCRYEIIAKKSRSSTADFIRKAKQVHTNDMYDYTSTNYERSHTKVTIICRTHGEFVQTPAIHLGGHGCQKCGQEAASNHHRMSTADFIRKAKIIHGATFDYSSTIYGSSQERVAIICRSHGQFWQNPNNHLQGHGCIKCENKQQSTTEEFIQKAKLVHGDHTFDYTSTNYVKALEKVTIACRLHGEFLQTPNNHLSGKGCPTCSCLYSRLAVSWLENTASQNECKIQHILNGGEFKIPGTNYRADGYCEETNTIYEFHGDYWHGNPSKYNSEDMNTVSGKTFGELYQKTMEKEQRIRDLGYNLVTMWESDFKQQ